LDNSCSEPFYFASFALQGSGNSQLIKPAGRLYTFKQAQPNLVKLLGWASLKSTRALCDTVYPPPVGGFVVRFPSSPYGALCSSPPMPFTSYPSHASAPATGTRLTHLSWSGFTPTTIWQLAGG